MEALAASFTNSIVSAYGSAVVADVHRRVWGVATALRRAGDRPSPGGP